ncbi:MAG: AMP-binding protein [Myxococcota bacterium]
MRQALAAELGAAPPLMRHALPAGLRGLSGETLAHVLARRARSTPGGCALIDAESEQSLSWAELEASAGAIAARLAREGVRQGDVVALPMPSGVRSFAAVLAAARLGVTAALVNPQLRGRPLAHAVEVARPARVLVAPELASALDEARVTTPRVLDDGRSGAPAPAPVRVRPGEDFVYIYTSGTTGQPKPVRVSHVKALALGAAFGAGVFGFGAKGGAGTLYNVLPLHHASGLLLGAGACLATGATMVLRPRFRASAFWDDVRRHDVTALLYIGELFRFVLAQPASPRDRHHGVRVAAGNGLRADVWRAFQQRFAVPRIVEFYGATEAPGALINLTGRVGKVGHLPLRRAGWLRLARYDPDSGDLVRGRDGFAIECATDEAGELLVRVPQLGPVRDLLFPGYTDRAATERKLARDVFATGDQWFRSGDLLTRDADDYYAFVDRVGDTFRWKGENVATAEVETVLSSAPGVQAVVVVGVTVPGYEGRAGLAALVLAPGAAFDGNALAKVAAELPDYAQPRFVRLLADLDTTQTFKVQKVRLRREGADPSTVRDPLYLRMGESYVPLEADLWDRVITKECRV